MNAFVYIAAKEARLEAERQSVMQKEGRDLGTLGGVPIGEHDDVMSTMFVCICLYIHRQQKCKNVL